jgi:hypothetical protein
LPEGNGPELGNLTMKIGKKAGPAEAASPPGWRIQLSASVLDHVPSDVLRPWLAVESFARSASECWPSNKALMGPMGVGSVRVVKALLERLEDYGIAQRRQQPGNRRLLVMVRRVSAELSAVEWSAMVDQAERRAEGRRASTKLKAIERKAHRPKIRIVS